MNFARDVSWWDGWAVFFTGAGAIVLLKAALAMHASLTSRAVTAAANISSPSLVKEDIWVDPP